MAQTTQLSITTASWTEVTGISAGTLIHLQSRFSFYFLYSETEPTGDSGYLVEDDKDTVSSTAEFIGQSLGKLWLKSKDQNQTIKVTLGSDIPISGSVSQVEVTIPNGEASSSAIDLGGKQIVAVTFPAAFTGSTIKFENASSLAGTYREVNQVDSASTYVVPVALNDQQPVDLWVSWGLSFVKLVSSATESSDRTLYLVVR